VKPSLLIVTCRQNCFINEFDNFASCFWRQLRKGCARIALFFLLDLLNGRPDPFNLLLVVRLSLKLLDQPINLLLNVGLLNKGFGFFRIIT